MSHPMSQLARDLRFAIRSLLRRPVFAAAAVLSLGLGIGANSAIFSLVNGIMWKPLPGVRHGDDLVRITSHRKGLPYPLGVSYRDFRDLVTVTAREFDALVAFSNSNFGVSFDGQPPELLWGLEVSGDYFGALGARPHRGRLLAAHDSEQRAPVAVLAHSLWRDRLHADPGSVGREIAIDGQSFTVVGVAEPGFIGTETLFENQIFVPLEARQRQVARGALENRSAPWLKVTGRLAAGQPRGPARRALDGQLEITSARFASEHPESHRDLTLHAMREEEARVEAGLGPAMNLLAGVLFALVGLVLLIACGNVANLLLSRAAARSRELALRAAIGAGRGHLLRQLLTESALLAVGGGALGIVLALLFARAFESIRLPTNLPLRIEVAPDARVLVFTATVALLAGLLFGALPAWRQARQDPSRGLRAQPAGGGGSALRLSNSFVVVQVALSLVLLIAAGLFLRSLQSASRLDLGIDPEGVAALTVDLGMLNRDETEARAFFAAAQQRLRGIAGVDAVSIGAAVPLDWMAAGFSIDTGRDLGGPGESSTLTLLGSAVGSGYFELIGTRIVAGRPFEERDDERGERVVIVNQRLAEMAWPDESPLGRQVRVNGAAPATVVGVAETGKYRLPGEAPAPYLYVPFMQMPRTLATLLVHTPRDVQQALEAARGELRAMAPDLSLFSSGALADTVDSRVSGPIGLMASLATTFGVLGLVLAAIGLYGVMAYAVAQRTREIGVRIALGESTRSVLGRVLRQGLRLAAIGGAVGAVAAFALTRPLGSLLIGVRAADPLTFSVVVTLLIGIALLASLVPALRAAHIDPIRTLKAD